MWSYVFIFACLLCEARAAPETKGTLYTKNLNFRVDQAQEFSLGNRAKDRTSCVVACAAHAQCESVNFRGGNDAGCSGTRKAYYSFNADVATESGAENFSPLATDVRDGDWILVFRAQKGVDTTSVDKKFQKAWENDALRSDDDLSSLDRNCYSPSKEGCTQFFRSRWMSEWPSNLHQVRLALFSVGSEVAQMTFNGSGATNETWFTGARLLSSTWSDLTPGDSSSPLYMHGAPIRPEKIMFLASTESSACPKDGWLVVYTAPDNICQVTRVVTKPGGVFSIPQFLYAPGSSKINFQQTSPAYAQADVMAIFIKLN